MNDDFNSRDLFAGLAMISIQQTIASLKSDYDPKEVAEDAYILADAMIEARRKHND